MENKRGNVWLAAAGLVINAQGEWLVVKKRYGGLHGKWSLPAGFVMGTETIDEAALREVKEETDIDCRIGALIGFRSGVIREKVSDNMAIFLMTAIDDNQPIKAQLSELYEAAWILPEVLAEDENASIMLHEMARYQMEEGIGAVEGVDPGAIFGYSTYKLFFKK